jgi:two-component system KDP operon response regulator KdpE
MSQATILVVDDEPRIADVVRGTLEPAGFEVVTAADGEQGLWMAEMHDPDLIVLDIGLPRMDGWEVCRRVREFTTAPILMLTARTAQRDKVKGLELGADDYLPKPFGVPELLARVRALLRRAKLPGESKRDPVFVCGDLSMNFAQRRVTVRGKGDVKLSPTEYKLLYELVTNAGRVLLHQDLLRKVWGRGYGEETEYLRVYVRYLRQKLEPDSSKPRYILTEPGVGYRFADPSQFAPVEGEVAESATGAETAASTTT